MAEMRATGWEGRQRRRIGYTPVMQFYLRMIRMAMFEALRVENVPCYYGVDLLMTAPLLRAVEQWDEAIMARDWIARPAPDPKVDRDGWVLSFDTACMVLGLDADHERLWMLEKIDAAADFDTDEVWARVEYLTNNPPDETEEPLFDAPRIVPALDQGNLFGLLEAA